MKTYIKITKEERAEHKKWMREQKKLDKQTPKLVPIKGIID